MKNALIQIPEKIKGLLNDYADDLEEAWAHLEDGETLNINLSAKVGFDKFNKPICEVVISFIKERVKGSVTFNWENKQIGLFKPCEESEDAFPEDKNKFYMNPPTLREEELIDQEKEK